MRAAVSVADIETINGASEEFLALKRTQSNDDCRMEVDWIDAALALGARPQLIEELRHRGAR
jgi:hypothetical protein